MKHITFSDKSLMSGDEVVDLLLEYAAALARTSDADTVDISAISSDGDEVIATFLLDAGAPLMAETTNSTLPEPDNAEAIAYMRERMQRLTHTQAHATDDEDEGRQSFEDEFGL